MSLDADFLVLCGGLGTRLRSVTGETPKVMAEVQGEPFLDFLIRYLISEGARRIILCAGYKAQAFEAYYQKKFTEAEIVLSIEPEPLGTGGAFKHAERHIRTDRVFGLNGDCFTPVRYADLLSRHVSRGSRATLVGVRVAGNKDFGTIVLNERQEITAFREKFETREVQYISAGIYCLERAVFGQMPAGKFSIEYDLFPRLIGSGFHAFPVDVPFIDIGTPERFAWAQENLNAMVRPK
ncbi:MAG: NTP transferase domain-containing protein [Elusimicrobia bacterium]|nr:NTP transferase domain-containing protein [Elusimicrobiota bacterium]